MTSFSQDNAVHMGMNGLKWETGQHRVKARMRRNLIPMVKTLGNEVMVSL